MTFCSRFFLTVISVVTGVFVFGTLAFAATTSFVLPESTTDQPDLAVEHFYLNRANELQIILHNRGGVDVTTPVLISVYVDGVLIMSYSSSTLSDQTFLTAYGMSVLSPQVIVGTHGIRACVDENNLVREVYENNNCLEGVVSGL